MKIFITGGTGFIGRHVLEKLQGENKFNILVLTRQQRDNQEGISYVQGDVSSASLIDECIRQSDCVIHMAGCKNNPDYFFQTNVRGTENVISACRKSKRLNKLVYLSSVGVIGKTNKTVVDEQTECNPVNEYEKTKLQAELIVREYSKENPGSTIILRPTNVFGENDPELHLLNLFGKIKRNSFYFVGKDIKKYYLNYVYVKEISELLPGLLYTETKNDLYIVNTPAVLLEFITTIKEILEDETPVKSLPYLPVRILARCFDLVPRSILRHPPVNSHKLSELTNKKQYSNALLMDDLKWRPAFTLKSALGNLASHYSQRRLI